MTLDVFIRMLQAHLSALQSEAWPQPHNASNGPAFFLDLEDTQALLADLTRARDAATSRSVVTPEFATPIAADRKTPT